MSCRADQMSATTIFLREAAIFAPISPYRFRAPLTPTFAGRLYFGGLVVNRRGEKHEGAGIFGERADDLFEIFRVPFVGFRNPLFPLGGGEFGIGGIEAAVAVVHADHQK